MVNKKHLTIDQQKQLDHLLLKSLELEQRQVLMNRDYADADILHLATFFRHNPNPVLVFDPDGGLIKTNPAAVRLLRRLQLEPTSLLPVEHSQIIQTCLNGQFKEYTLEVKVKHHTLSLMYHALPSFKLVYLYAIDLTDYRQAEAELLQSVATTIALAKQTVLQLQAFRNALPRQTTPAVKLPSYNVPCYQNALDNVFIAMDGCAFSSVEE